MSVAAAVTILASGIVACMVLLTIGGVVYMIIGAAKGGGSSKSGQMDADEAQLMQEIHHGFRKMEQRIEALETLMLDEDRGKRSKFDRELRGE